MRTLHSARVANVAMQKLYLQTADMRVDVGKDVRADVSRPGADNAFGPIPWALKKTNPSEYSDRERSFFLNLRACRPMGIERIPLRWVMLSTNY